MNGKIRKQERRYITLKLERSTFNEFRNRAFDKDISMSNYLKKLMELEDAKYFFNDSAFSAPLMNILKGVEREAKQKKDQDQQAFRW